MIKIIRYSGAKQSDDETNDDSINYDKCINNDNNDKHNNYV